MPVELELGVSDDPRALILGDPSALAATEQRFAAMADAFGRTADGLDGIRVGEWQGAAADAFRGRFPQVAQQWTAAHAAFAGAAAGWRAYRDEVSRAQGRAAEAVVRYRAALAASQDAVADRNAAIDRYNTQVRAAAAGYGPAPAPLPAFVDPGPAQVSAARAVLAAARRERDEVAARVAATLRNAASVAPDPPTGWDALVASGADVLGADLDGARRFVKGVAQGGEDLVRSVRAVNPADPWNARHPARYTEAVSTSLAGLVTTAVHPVRLVGRLLGTGWGSDPVAAAGRLVPTIALAALTDGAGSAAGAAARSAAEAGVRSAEETGARSAAEAGVRSAEETGARSAAEAGVRSAEETGARTAAEAGVRSVEETGARSAAEAGVRSAEETGARSAAEAGVRPAEGEGAAVTGRAGAGVGEAVRPAQPAAGARAGVREWPSPAAFAAEARSGVREAGSPAGSETGARPGVPGWASPAPPVARPTWRDAPSTGHDADTGPIHRGPSGPTWPTFSDAGPSASPAGPATPARAEGAAPATTAGAPGSAAALRSIDDRIAEELAHFDMYHSIVGGLGKMHEIPFRRLHPDLDIPGLVAEPPSVARTAADPYTPASTPDTAPPVSPHVQDSGAAPPSTPLRDEAGRAVVPAGFADRAAFERFGDDLRSGLLAAGHPKARAAFQGSSVTGVKYTTGKPFDHGRVSDFDIALTDRELFAMAREKNFPMSRNPTRTRPLGQNELKKLGLLGLQQELSATIGRPVAFMLYENFDDALTRSPSIEVTPR